MSSLKEQGRTKTRTPTLGTMSGSTMTISSLVLMVTSSLLVSSTSAFLPTCPFQKNAATSADLRDMTPSTRMSRGRNRQILPHPYQSDKNNDNSWKERQDAVDQIIIADLEDIATLSETPLVQRHYETFRWYPQGKKENADNNENDVDIDETIVYNINYRVEGPVDGEPVLLIHGFGANVGHFRHQFPALTDAGHRVYAIDMLGFGASDKPDLVYSIELFATLIRDFVLTMEELISPVGSDPKRWVVAGNSIGGLCSLAVAEQLPDLVRGVVLFNCAGGMTAFRYEDVPNWLRPILFLFKNVILGPRMGGYFFKNFKSRENVESILRYQGVYRNHTNVDEELLHTLLEPGNDEGAETVFLKVFGGEPGPTPESILPKLDCPVLALWGGADPWTPVDAGMHPGTEFHRYMKEESMFTLVVLDGVGHCPHDEVPEQANAQMIRWIQSLPVRTTAVDDR